MDIHIDPESFTLGEIDEIEQISGESFADIAQQLVTGKFATRVLVGVVKVCVARDSPEFTEDDARALKITELNLVVDPTEAADEPRTGPDSPDGSESAQTSSTE